MKIEEAIKTCKKIDADLFLYEMEAIQTIITEIERIRAVKWTEYRICMYFLGDPVAEAYDKGWNDAINACKAVVLGEKK